MPQRERVAELMRRERLNRRPFSSTSVGFASPKNGHPSTIGVTKVIRSYGVNIDAGIATRSDVASQLEDPRLQGPATAGGMENRPPEEARKKASVSAPTRSRSSLENGTGPSGEHVERAHLAGHRRRRGRRSPTSSSETASADRKVTRSAYAARY